MWLLGHVALGWCGDIGDTAASSLGRLALSRLPLAYWVSVVSVLSVCS